MKQIGCAFTAKYLVAIRLVTERTNELVVGGVLLSHIETIL
jgi:hypothetical protein